MESSDSENEYFESQNKFWNNWKPRNNVNYSTSQGNFRHAQHSIATWIPPIGFGKKRRINESQETPLEVDLEPEINKSVELGPRLDFDQLVHSEENTVSWMYIHPGYFGNFNVSINENKELICYAHGEIDSENHKEKIFLVINQEEILKKLLEIKQHQWAAIKECLEETRGTKTMHYSALKRSTLSNLPSFLKLWHLVCRRRHFLPGKIIHIKRSGVQKIQQLFVIAPKFIVTDITTISGEEIDLT